MTLLRNWPTHLSESTSVEKILTLWTWRAKEKKVLSHISTRDKLKAKSELSEGLNTLTDDFAQKSACATPQIDQSLKFLHCRWNTGSHIPPNFQANDEFIANLSIINLLLVVMISQRKFIQWIYHPAGNIEQRYEIKHFSVTIKSNIFYTNPSLYEAIPISITISTASRWGDVKICLKKYNDNRVHCKFHWIDNITSKPSD